MINQIKQLAKKYFNETIEIRRHLHQYPELSFEEHNTSKYICSKLQEYNISYTSGLVKTGIVAIIEGKNPTKKTVALRGDIDALPIIEENDINYKSVNVGVMHACGHDVHTASLLTTVKILNELKSQFEGTIKIIFQPGEEKLPGGASLMIKEGVLENPKPDNIIGQHVYPELEAGKVGFRAGKYMASADELYVTVHGEGGHAALPHQNIDPILISSHILTSLQQLVSRVAPPTIPTVLSFGKIIGNGATNVIPDKVEMEGTFRTMDEGWRVLAHQKMKLMAESIAKSMGGKCDFRIEKGYPFLVNDKITTNKAKQAAINYLGKENVVDLELRMTAEDFAFFSQEAPSCFYRLGVKPTNGKKHTGLHTSTFNIDEQALETGSGLMAWIALNELQV